MITPNTDKRNRAVGSFIGLAIGDALGAPVEFKTRGSFEPVTDMIGGGYFDLPAGYWTDDTSMALCLADSLLACRGFDTHDQMERYAKWFEHGENSSIGQCFDIGSATRKAIRLFILQDISQSPYTDHSNSGNGSIMRLAPVPIFYHDDIQKAVMYGRLSSITTHGSDACLSACEYLSLILWRAINGETDKHTLLADNPSKYSEHLHSVINGDYQHKSRDEIVGSGYVVASLEAALWCFYHTDNFADAVLAAVNLGDDADTTAAICGQIAGAYYGVDALPTHWLEKLYERDRLVQLADDLFSNQANRG